MNYIELSVDVMPVEEGSDILIAQLSDLGFDSFVNTDNGFNAYISENDYSENAVADLLGEYSNVLKASFKTAVIPQQNWNQQWESSFQPIEVDGKCCIRAPFHNLQSKFEYDIIIEPKMSFGTGHHQTTQLMISKLMQLDVKNKSLLDMGCGTGVLAILAAKMGANPILAVDIDDWSYENTLENLHKNNINTVNVQKGNAQKIVGKLFYVILANINKNVLLTDMQTYSDVLEKGGKLLLSGFFETDVRELQNKASECGLISDDVMVNEQWAMISLNKMN